MHPLAETDGTVRARRQERLHRISFKAEQSSNGSLLYCTGYELQPHTRAGDIVVTELRVTVRPGAAAAPTWARFFKARRSGSNSAGVRG
jgi:hypothetical protein